MGRKKILKSKIKQVKEKIEGDYKVLCEYWKARSKEELINDGYRIAHCNEIVDLFANMEDDDDTFDEETLDAMIDSRGNLILAIYNDWQDYRHPERYNFFSRECLIDIVKYTFVAR